jgi:uncharacterized membrane protein YhiD involved in acid resistance
MSDALPFGQSLFDGFEDLTSTFTVLDIVLALGLSFLLGSVVGFVYRQTHHGVSYSQSYVQTLVVMGMLVSLIMLVVGSNIARAFSLVGALSIVRFRNAVKETRDVGFIFFAMAIGMATGTRFYALALIATVVIAGAIWLMDRFDWFKLDVQSQVVKIETPPDLDPALLSETLAAHTKTAELISAASIRGGALNELVYTVKLTKDTVPTQLMAALQQHTGGQKVTVLTGYDNSDL